MPKQQKQEGKIDKAALDELDYNMKLKFKSLQTQIDEIKSKHEMLREETGRSMGNILPDIKKLHRKMAQAES